MGSAVTSPFGEAAVSSVALENPPLALVVAQVRFPVILAIADGSTILAEFQDRIRDGYPEVKQTTELSLSPAGAQAASQELIKGKVWHFTDPDTGWEVAVANSFVALSTQRYTNREDFVGRLGRLLDTTLNVMRPTMAQRVGVRYSARIEGEGLIENIPKLFRSEITSATRLTDTEPVQHAVTDVLFNLADSTLQARWGLLPAGATMDPTISPAPNATFVLDIDVASRLPIPFRPTAIAETAKSLGNQQYRFFRWAVTDDFLRDFGGRV